MHYAPSGHNVPNLKITYYNTRSLSAYTKGKHGIIRRNRVIRNIKSILNNSHILCLQETHLLPYDDFTLRSELKNYKICYNNLGTAGGTMIILHTSVLKFYDIIEFKLGKNALGRVQALRLNPVRQKGAGTQRYDLPLNIINWHLEGDKNAQLSTLLRVNSKVRTIAGGDCNFVISSEDAPSNNSGIIIGGKLKKIWDTVASHFRFAEVSQPTHTHYFVPKDLNYEKVRTSRIDRIYISTDLADAALFKPISYIPFVPYSILRMIKAIKQSGGLGTRYVCDWVSDHLPISIQLVRNKNTPAIRNLPRWIADEKSFIDGIHTKLDSLLTASVDPFDALQLFSSTLDQDAHDFILEAKGKKDNKRSDTAALHICFNALRLISSATPNIARIRDLARKHAFLDDHLPSLDSLPLDDSKLRLHINTLLVVEADGSCELEDVFGKTLDKILNNLPPSTKAPKRKWVSEEADEVRANGNLRNGSHIHALRADSSSPPTSDPTRIANILRDFWQKLGNARKDAPCEKLTDEYIKDYEVTIPQHLSPKMPTIDDIIDCIHATNNSCPGPDGVHFALIRPFAHKLAPVILAVMQHMADGNPPPPPGSTTFSSFISLKTVAFLPKTPDRFRSPMRSAALLRKSWWGLSHRLPRVFLDWHKRGSFRADKSGITLRMSPAYSIQMWRRNSSIFSCFWTLKRLLTRLIMALFLKLWKKSAARAGLSIATAGF
jgi:hypothetical protein